MSDGGMVWVVDSGAVARFGPGLCPAVNSFPPPLAAWHTFAKPQAVKREVPALSVHCPLW